MANYLENKARKESLTDEGILKLISDCNCDFCPHCGADHRPNWYGGKRYKPLSNYSEGSFPIGHCCLERFDDWIILIDLVSDKRINIEQLRGCH
jgi:hypothetical protein